MCPQRENLEEAPFQILRHADSFPSPEIFWEVAFIKKKTTGPKWCDLGQAKSANQDLIPNVISVSASPRNCLNLSIRNFLISTKR